MGVNQVYYELTKIIDLTDATATADNIRVGYSAYGKEGNLLNGNLRTASLEPYVEEQNSGYISTGSWIPELPTNTYIDIYKVQAGHRYLIALGSNVGSRFRVMFSTADISKATSTVTGTSIINTNNPASFASATYTTSADGYISIGKDNIGKTGIKTYVYDCTASWL